MNITIPDVSEILTQIEAFVTEILNIITQPFVLIADIFDYATDSISHLSNFLSSNSGFIQLINSIFHAFPYTLQAIVILTFVTGIILILMRKF